MFLVAVVNYYVLGPLPISLPLLLPVLAVAGGTLEGAPFGAVYGAACGMVMSSLGYLGPGCVISLSLFGWLSGLTTQYLLRRDAWGHLICSLFSILTWEGWTVGVRLVSHTAPAADGGPGAAVDPGPGPARVLGGPVLLCKLREDLP